MAKHPAFNVTLTESNDYHTVFIITPTDMRRERAYATHDVSVYHASGACRVMSHGADGTWRKVPDNQRQDIRDAVAKLHAERTAVVEPVQTDDVVTFAPEPAPLASGPFDAAAIATHRGVIEGAQPEVAAEAFQQFERETLETVGRVYSVDVYAEAAESIAAYSVVGVDTARRVAKAAELGMGYGVPKPILAVRDAPGTIKLPATTGRFDSVGQAEIVLLPVDENDLQFGHRRRKAGSSKGYTRAESNDDTCRPSLLVVAPPYWARRQTESRADLYAAVLGSVPFAPRPIISLNGSGALLRAAGVLSRPMGRDTGSALLDTLARLADVSRPAPRFKACGAAAVELLDVSTPDWSVVLIDGHWRHVSHVQGLATSGWGSEEIARRNADTYRGDTGPRLIMAERYVRFYGPRVSV